MILCLPNSSFLIAKRSLFTTSVVCKRIPFYPKLISNEIIQHPRQELTEEDELLNNLKNKLVYNSLVSERNKQVRWRIRYENLKRKALERLAHTVPLSLKYMYDESLLNVDEFRAAFPTGSANEEKFNMVNEEDKDSSGSVNLPYSIVKDVQFISGSTETEQTETIKRSTNFISSKGIF